jgi:hypothetical protein
MPYLQQIVFTILFLAAIWLFTRKAKEIAANIRLGKEEDYSDRPGERWKNMLLLAFGQKKMFRKPIVALLHFIIYAGFLIINIEVLEIILDGMLAHTACLRRRWVDGILSLSIFLNVLPLV